MTCNLTRTPWEVDPLPLYSREDPDAASIYSNNAPSYVSETPTYTTIPTQRHNNMISSLLPPSTANERTPGLPDISNFPSRGSAVPGSQVPVLYTNSWRSVTSNVNSRQYLAVARRRANAAANTNVILNSFTVGSSTTNLALRDSREGSPNASSTNVSTQAYPVSLGGPSGSVNPLEDPYLVGEDAARRARAQRVYREMCLYEEETTRHESRGWEFMMGQMVDWTEREQNWRHLRSRVANARLLTRRVGLRT
ncbi:hypothetical protein BU24DRAFT_119235 [Aaosphaeria arxii CBS 175.79]|uniref:Uncharacterized protein n=1 Tax=Aaosphaeria arxii CBS 175.79 TaxID=1450172 RepID=A0A6A5Y2E0_9PLEO|nr:uncharacterized protein BU24DRAFT_119235 [Aaosphaeria arxii CBS 175.79]KAF2019396.1 hypothetical protein BU24DRAFT_119235 [Aaosphaeria arxii CBS 175.79]